ncbi:cell division protein FtsL [Cycloclasticus sp. 46_120_T64]|mgnify:FL=1|nr:cell division protein FtsL [Cycloclasticus sp. 46_120_T64]
MLLQGSTTGVVLFAILTMVSALSVVYVKYDSRLKFNQFQGELREQDRLGVEWGRLQLEAYTWSSQNSIEKLARAKLNLQAPSTEQVIYLNVK